MKKTYITIILLLGILNLVLSFKILKFNDKYKEIQILYSAAKNRFKNITNQLEDSKVYYFDSFSVNNYVIPIKAVLTDEQNNTFFIKDVFTNNKEVLFFRYFESSCNDCVNKYFSRLKRSIDRTGNRDIYILASISDSDSFNNEINTFGIEVFFIEENIFESDIVGKPYMFTMNSTLITRNGFVPIETELDFIEEYTFRVLSRVKR